MGVYDAKAWETSGDGGLSTSSMDMFKKNDQRYDRTRTRNEFELLTKNVVTKGETRFEMKAQGHAESILDTKLTRSTSMSATRVTHEQNFKLMLSSIHRSE